jgi:hypothetical protein
MGWKVWLYLVFTEISDINSCTKPNDKPRDKVSFQTDFDEGGTLNG